MSWTTFQMTVVTPLFSGDDPHETSTTSPIRVPSIRGALRFWFRAIAAGRGITDLEKLAKAEEEVFGSTKKPSPIAMRVMGQPQAEVARNTPTWATDQGLQYFLGQGIWKHGVGVTRPFIDPGSAKFELQVKFSGNEYCDARFMTAMWAWLAYGGLGARVRRGFGRIRCTGVYGPEATRWGGNFLASPSSAQGWKAIGSNNIYTGEVTKVVIDAWPSPTGTPWAGMTLPNIPTLAADWWDGGLMAASGRTWSQALATAARSWRDFRAPDRTPGAPTNHSPEWNSVVRGTDTDYPIAALGLPVGYFDPKTKNKWTANLYKATGAELRRASPVWIIPVQCGDEWRVFTHLFFAQVHPAGTEVALKGATPRRALNAVKATSQWNNWLDGRKRL